MPKRSPLAPVVALAALVALGGCGGATENAPQPSQAAAAKDKKHQLESVKADCMKQKGFKYVAYVQPPKQDSEDDKARNAGDYQAMRKYREKYGFGVFAMHVYPKEMGNPAVKPDNPQIDPNWKIQSSLSKAQATAYRKAADGCMIEAAKKILGKTLKSMDDYFNQQNRASEQALARTVNSDPKLIELASAMAGCLKGKGYPIGKTTPMAMSQQGQEVFLTQEDKLGREQRDDVPDVAPPLKEGEVKMTYAPTLTPAEATPYLTKEIKAALDDLECGKAFYPAYLPKAAVAQQQVDEEFGM
ncbi:hypothetical protein [Nonomuraea guangzhouensis]|uniref:Lipoprotein n=1 Tax=Nonomuraea guangzhouensis TaxID=1291555 RepID=A0ABW4GQD8_9ACTN|nr:hypothetical protein [Nonomuraea guangzhouensis]